MEIPRNPYQKKVINGREEIVFSDPRPDLDDGSGLESYLWADLLSIMFKINKDAARTIHGFRCQGCRLVKGEKIYVIRPQIGPDGWESQEEYDKAKKKYLEPIRGDVLLALKRLH
jgi:hypothetical protein